MGKNDVMGQLPTGDPAFEWLYDRAAQVDAQRARRENFPVASRLLRATMRRDLLASYAVARLIDDAGDEAPGDRLVLLDFIDADLDRINSGEPALSPVSALTEGVRERGLPVWPFHDLVAAGRMDQQVGSYPDLAALRGYCRLSAEPVGRLVLALWGQRDEEQGQLSDDICTGLQIAEHLQDVGEDLAAGRVYLPLDTLAAHEVTVAMLQELVDGTLPTDGRLQVAAAMGALSRQARTLLNDGAALTGRVPGAARVAVAGFVAGGLAALDAVARAGADAVTTTPKPRRRTVLWRTGFTLVSNRKGPGSRAG